MCVCPVSGFVFLSCLSVLFGSFTLSESICLTLMLLTTSLTELLTCNIPVKCLDMLKCFRIL